MKHCEPKKPLGKMRGATLLEVLVSVLIFACVLLAVAGQQAGAVKTSGDVPSRAEAVHLVNAYVGKMKAMAPTSFGGGGDMVTEMNAFVPQFDHGGAEFGDGTHGFQGDVWKLPGAKDVVEDSEGNPTVNPKVDFNPSPATPGLPAGTREVEITVYWQPPGEKDTAGNPVTHMYQQRSVIRNN
jgi:hypothetical protein